MTKGKRFLSVIAACAMATTTLVSSGVAAHADNVLTIATDLPLQGAPAAANNDTNSAIELYLKSINYTVGKYTVQLKKYDDATAAAGSWDPAQCASNAQAHVANTGEVAVMGTYNSGCAKIIVPVLNQDPNGPMLMVSHANTNVGLTQPYGPGEPAKYYPSGKRNYARVCINDNMQGSAAAQFAYSKGIKTVYVMNDTQTYGQGVAASFTAAAKKLGMKVLSSGASGQGWDAKQTSYKALFTKIKPLHPQLIYFGGIFDNNGGQLVKDKTSVLGDNSHGTRIMVPDGFEGYPEFTKLKGAQDAWMTFPGLSADLLVAKYPNGPAAKFLSDFQAAYGHAPTSAYSIYGVAAVQVILAAIAKSDGTRTSVTSQVFSGSGIQIPASTSILGREITISTKTGDTDAKDLTILTVTDNREVTLQSWSAK